MNAPTSPFPQTLDGWLAHCERLHPLNIDMGLERVRKVADRLQLKFDCPVITVAGTNGKGSTCAMLEAVAQQAGYRTGVYTSPHLVHFEERCRIHGESVSAIDLVANFAAVESARVENGDEISLTYFEFSTLAILRLLSLSQLDVAILEKAGIMRPGKPVVISDPVPPQSVLDHAAELGADVWRFGVDFNFSGDKQQWGWAGRGRRYSGLAYPALRGANQLMNASGVLAALEALRTVLPVTAQAVRNGLALVELPGRFQIIPGEPVLVLDVAHNPHSVAALAENIDAMGFYPVTHAVFGAMADKDLGPMLARIDPLVDRWYFTDLPTARAETGAQLVAKWNALQMVAGGRRDVRASAFTSPQLALQAAIAAAGPADRIVVFGSFYTVGGILHDGLPRLHAKHLGK